MFFFFPPDFFSLFFECLNRGNFSKPIYQSDGVELDLYVSDSTLSLPPFLLKKRFSKHIFVSSVITENDSTSGDGVVGVVFFVCLSYSFLPLFLFFAFL